MVPVRVRYNRLIGVVALPLALFILGVAFLTGELVPQGITGGLLVGLSLAYLTQPAYVLTSTEVEMKNLLGMTLRRLPYTSPSELVIDDGRLIVAGQKVKIPRWMIHPPDWRELEAKVESLKR